MDRAGSQALDTARIGFQPFFSEWKTVMRTEAKIVRKQSFSH